MAFPLLAAPVISAPLMAAPPFFCLFVFTFRFCSSTLSLWIFGPHQQVHVSTFMKLAVHENRIFWHLLLDKSEMSEFRVI